MYASTFIATILAAASAVTAIPTPQNNNNNLDFGTCIPTISFELGRPGRKADEGTFLPLDPAILKGQSDALNPAIITNRVCDQLDSQTCNANQAAIDACLAAKATVDSSGVRDASTAEQFNSLLGF